MNHEYDLQLFLKDILMKMIMIKNPCEGCCFWLMEEMIMYALIKI